MEIDILGAPYERHIIDLPSDDEGPVVATLVRRRAEQPTKRAVLYLHGFCDYFFQTHLADFFADRGWDFYALDLRKYGRSLLGHQTPNFVRSLTEYFPEIDEAIRIIRAEDGHDTVLINGHSTGGLIGSLWADSRRKAKYVDGLFLNSPFLDFNAPWLIRRPLAPIVSGLASLGHYRKITMNVSGTYGRSIHADHNGEWTYDLAWKPVESFPVRLGWLRAIREGHLRVRRGLAVDVPILVTASDASFKKPSWDEVAHDMDAVLDVDHIVRWAPNLGDQVTVVRIPGGKHDLTLSRPPARERLFTEVDSWLTANLNADAADSAAKSPNRAATPADPG
ncbi:alpha-beta hydrolase superfamily lysophospholipase [Hamadaea flava]|uniref:Alpha/beta hydrolase n=1 Tax=Hamadaea flava TaxID=1742688 RepID=A0ABV8LK16_9ACTN|nr:alpha/beta hydrolase [Hamadaea flava]MCP2325023.1 alpha-beta hydrolase superfamily lysophospholipase [Hamadaea flava]